jgi:hypothetical protein
VMCEMELRKWRVGRRVPESGVGLAMSHIVKAPLPQAIV